MYPLWVFLRSIIISIEHFSFHSHKNVSSSELEVNEHKGWTVLWREPTTISMNKYIVAEVGKGPVALTHLWWKKSMGREAELP